MILTKNEILKEIKFEPGLDAFQLQSCAVDLRLSESILLGFRAHALLKTLEKVTMPKNVVGIVYPRSSLNRREITLDMTGIVDPGYEGHLTLPVTNWHMEKADMNDELRKGMYKGTLLKKGERIASIVFHRISSEVDPRLSKYHNSDGTFVPDKGEEAELIAAGDLETLKQKYSL